MADQLASLADVLARTEARLRDGQDVTPPVWATGFTPLDGQLGGGLRAGELTLLGGPQGLGKTTWAVQAAWHIVRGGGRVLYFSFEHEQESFLERLIAMVAFEVGGLEAPTTRRIRERITRAERLGAREGLPALLQDLPGATEALAELVEAGDRFIVHESSGRSTSAAAMRAHIQALPAGAPPVVIVDYLQKVPSADGDVGEPVEQLKDLALEQGIAVLAVAAADERGISPGHRMRLHEMRGSSSLAYEPDVVLILNEKYDVVARHHLTFGVGNAERFRDYAVLSIEKNRGGAADIDLEFRKHFGHASFDPIGQLVQEKLVDERVNLQ